MSELLPVAQAESLRAALLEYLGTTFALSETTTRTALEEFLSAPGTSMFRGPYVRLRLPFRPADDGWRGSLEWYEGFTPYGHQAAAFRRLTSLGADGAMRRPLPTLVTTGTGSGKTECFLYPILDHVLRANRAGLGGIKAIILYPMNALANDQAKRLAQMLTSQAALGGITAALYTGEGGAERSRVTQAGLITDRHVIRDNPPDILLTNYKMLDQLLLRHHDATLWSASARSLQYLILDEFHTYDGAQGTDVAMLIRRLGLALKAHWPTDAAERAAAGITEADQARPLGKVTPVATSATLGDKDDPAVMLDFAHTVFGEAMTADAVITESRLTVDEWGADAADIAARYAVKPVMPDDSTLAAIVNETGSLDDPDRLTRIVLEHLYQDATGDETANRPDLALAPIGDLALLAKAHPLVAGVPVRPSFPPTLWPPHPVTGGTPDRPNLVGTAQTAIDLSALTHALLEPARTRATTPHLDHIADQGMAAILSALSHIRATTGRGALSVDVHLWTRELTRLNRAATGAATFRWQDDGVVLADDSADETTPPYFPAIYCRHCGRSGWGVRFAPTGTDLDTSDDDIRKSHFERNDRFRPLIHAPAEGDKVDGGGPVDGLMWFLPTERRITVTHPASDADLTALPVLTHPIGDAGAKPAKDDVCPSCGQKDGIRFLGAAIATLLSVALSSIFGSPGLDASEKKALVFTDSVQDAAHRAGFIQARSHALTIRSVIRQAMRTDAVDLDTLVDRILDDAGDDPSKRYRLLPPDLAELDKFREFWELAVTQPRKANHYLLKARIRRRLALDIQLEFGLRSAVGRTLEATGTAVAHVRAEQAVMLAAAREVLRDAGWQGTLDTPTPSDDNLVAWVRGVLEHMRTRGAIDHEWFTKFRQEDGNRWWITGGRKRYDGMPGFGTGTSAPGFPRLGGAVTTGVGAAAPGEDLEPVASPRGWYAVWAAKNLTVDATAGATYSRLLMAQLEKRDIIAAVLSSSGGKTFHLPPSSVVVTVADLAALGSGQLSLECSDCGTLLPGTRTVIRQLEGSRCLVARCNGILGDHAVTDNFYRCMYTSSDPARVVAREHTSILEDAVRLQYETAFKATNPEPNAPNVLVATPTLEMGIDIGDLSTVFLSSLPRTVASYLQRVGRAGRLTGNALSLAFVTARGDQLPRFADPSTVINGDVRPPATYLDAEEILRRQYVAYLADQLARTTGAPHPRRAIDAIGTSEPGSYLGDLITLSEQDGQHLCDQFLATFTTVTDPVKEGLRAWALPTVDAATGESTASGLVQRIHAASIAWRAQMETLTHREQAIQQAIAGPGGLAATAESPAATDSDKTDLRTARAALKLTQGLRSEAHNEHWVGVLEEYGLLPNYTLLDDSVALEVSLSWIDPDTQDFAHENMELTRGSAQALRDFAPGSTFYARGYAIEIDALDLGRGEDTIRTWACCPSCGYSSDITDAGLAGGNSAPTACPRCQDAAIADVSQHLEVVELRRVSSVIKREEATIDDRTDERDQARFTLRPLADIDSEAEGSKWFVQDYGFGARYLRAMTIRWLNLGKTSAQGTTVTVAGQAQDVARFRVCQECGKLDKSTLTNDPREHRPWCSLRKKTAGKTREVSLARSLTTEGLVLRLPESVTLGDDFSLPSLRAAVLLALQLRIGGSPDHLAVVEIVDPSPAADSPAGALLLHDIVRGGTGYLAELANHDAVWAMLRTAWLHLDQCPCQDDGKLSCEHCLLPYAPGRDATRVSRATASRYLKALLLGTADAADDAAVPDTCPWPITAAEPTGSDPESRLEQEFRRVLRPRLERIGATIIEQPRSTGNTWSITLPGGAHWRLEPQVLIPEAGCKPDFVLTSDRAGIPRTAIFCDGWRYHASPGINRLADDASKRQGLRDAGYQVLSLTWPDLDPDVTHVPPAWLHPSAPAEVLKSAGDTLSAAALNLVQAPTLDLLLGWIGRPDVEERRALAKWLPYLAAPQLTVNGALPSETVLGQVALGVLDGHNLPSGVTFGGVWTHDTLAIGIRLYQGTEMEIAVVLDDATGSVGSDHKDAWHEWLRLGNLLNFRDMPTAVTTRTLGEQSVSAVVPTTDDAPALDDAERGLSGDTVTVNPSWADAVADATPDELAIIAAVSDTADLGVETPTIGDEVGDGIPLAIAWPTRKVAVDLDLTDDDRAWLVSDGWTLSSPQADALRAALTDSTT